MNEKMKGSLGAGSSLLLAGCLRLAAAYNPQQTNFTLPPKANPATTQPHSFISFSLLIHFTSFILQ